MSNAVCSSAYQGALLGSSTALDRSRAGKRQRSSENPGISSQVATFTGTVKHKPNPEKGYGFVECDEIRREYPAQPRVREPSLHSD